MEFMKGPANAEKPAAAGTGRARWRRVALRVDPVAALALVGFERLDRVPGFLHGAGHEPADGVLLPAHLLMISASVAPSFRCSMATTCAVLLPSRGPALSSALPASQPSLPWAPSSWGGVSSLGSAGAPCGSCAPTLAAGSRLRRRQAPSAQRVRSRPGA